MLTFDISNFFFYLFFIEGSIQAFIRTCTDGSTFYVKGVDGLTNVQPDNQTNFGYAQAGYLLSVNVCKEDLCNGPRYVESGFNLILPSYITMTLLSLLCIINIT